MGGLPTEFVSGTLSTGAEGRLIQELLYVLRNGRKTSSEALANNIRAFAALERTINPETPTQKPDGTVGRTRKRRRIPPAADGTIP